MTIKAEILFRNISTEHPVLVAVSGGSDSIALLLLANIWALKKGVTLQAVTVDHGLRPEAAAEAAFVSSVCAGLGVPHVTLAWEGMKPSFGIQEAARQSRYSLMDDFAHEIGADIILTGHNKDDQGETILMRSLRHSVSGDGRGLSGMDRKTWLYGGTKIYRPLLNLTREELRGFLGEMAQSWIEDPSNLDESYERVRIRRILSENPALKNNVHRFGGVSSRLREALSADVASFLKEKVIVNPGPVYILQKVEGMNGVVNPVLAYAIQALVALSGGQSHLIARHRLSGVFAMLTGRGDEQGKAGSPAKLTLGGATIEYKKGNLCFYREARNQSSLLLEPNEAAIWDGRMHLYNGTAMPVFIEVASRQQIRDFEASRDVPYRVKPRAALRSTPIVHIQMEKGGTTPCLPLVESTAIPKGLEIRLASPAIEHFCPEFDAPLREWVRSMDQYPAASLQP